MVGRRLRRLRRRAARRAHPLDTRARLAPKSRSCGSRKRAHALSRWSPRPSPQGAAPAPRAGYPWAMRGIVLTTPNGRRHELTPQSPRQRFSRALSLAVASIVSLFLWGLVLWPVLAWPATAQSDAEIANAIIRECAAIYHATGHPCACPGDRARNGSRCGGRSAYSKPGGAEPRCYVKDVSAQEIADYRGGRKTFTADCTPSTRR